MKGGKFVRYTTKHNGKNYIPLKNAICGIAIPYWKLSSISCHEKRLAGDAVDRLAAYEDIGLTPEEIREALRTLHNE